MRDVGRRLPRRLEFGQSLVEFVLVAPVLIMLVVLVADFGRVFAASLSLEAAARDAAEVMANKYLSNPPGAILLDQPAPAGNSAYYGPLHALAAQTICAETADLQNTAFDPATSTCAGMPLIQACIHDSQDTDCAGEVQGAAIPAECGDLAIAPSNNHAGSGTPRWAEVRVCYRFTALLSLPLLSFGDIWLQKTRTFVIPCYFALGSSECG
ncbi:MAG TPA: TadE family protein [Candidatus Limnocylindrales bacterium]|nr:TadE family protein [Candidatus Limnocylindrales bacterium]